MFIILFLIWWAIGIYVLINAILEDFDTIKVIDFLFILFSAPFIWYIIFLLQFKPILNKVIIRKKNRK